MEAEELKREILLTFEAAASLDRTPTTEQTYEELDIDSIDEVEILEAMEDRFNVEISDEEAEKIKTVGDMVNLVVSKKL